MILENVSNHEDALLYFCGDLDQFLPLVYEEGEWLLNIHILAGEQTILSQLVMLHCGCCYCHP